MKKWKKINKLLNTKILKKLGIKFQLWENHLHNENLKIGIFKNNKLIDYLLIDLKEAEKLIK